MASKDFMVICGPVGLGALDQEVSGVNMGANDQPFSHWRQAH